MRITMTETVTYEAELSTEEVADLLAVEKRESAVLAAFDDGSTSIEKPEAWLLEHMHANFAAVTERGWSVEA